MDITVLPSHLRGHIAVPPSKSAAHRAIIAAALAKGRSVIENVDLSSDISATIGACQSLGAFVRMRNTEKYHTLEIDGGLQIAGSAQIDCAESGSTLRFFIPIACAHPGEKTFDGHGRLPERPIDAYFQIFESEGISYTHPNGKNLPLTVSGMLGGGEYIVDGSVSSQYITGLLFALPLLHADSHLRVVNSFESQGYVDLTVSILEQFGIHMTSRDSCYDIRGNQVYLPQRHVVEGDFSQAAFFIAGGALSGPVVIAGLNPDSLQPDRVIIDIVRRMGADIRWLEDGLHVEKSALHGIDIDMSQCPDLVPPLAVAAAGATGITRITGAGRLRIKESDRLSAISRNLNTLGIRTEESADGLTIHGGRIQQGTIDSYNDHRIVMAFSIAALGSENGLHIKEAECINKSYPGFFKDLAALGGNIA